MQQLNKQALQTQRQKIEQQSELFAVTSELADWKRLELILFKFFVAYAILHTVHYISTLLLTQTFTVFLMVAEILKCLMRMLLMLAFLNPTENGKWRSYIILYMTAAYNLGLLMNDHSSLITNILVIPTMKLYNMLLYVGLLILHIIIQFITSGYALLYGSLLISDIMLPLLPLTTAVCLMIISKRHEKSE